MDFIKDFKLVNSLAIKNTGKGLRKNWYIIFLGFIYWIISILVITLSGALLRGPFSILYGLVITLLISSLLSNYLAMLELTVLEIRINFDSFKDGFKYYLIKVYGIFFIMYLFNYLLDILGMVTRTNVSLLNSLIYIGFFILFNPLPEAIYLKNYQSMDTIKYSLGFMKDNWIDWLIPNVLVALVFYLIFGGFSKHFLLGVGSGGPIFIFRGLAKSLLSQVFIAFFMVYRGNLFKILSTSTRRNRKYKYDRD